MKRNQQAQKPKSDDIVVVKDFSSREVSILLATYKSGLYAHDVRAFRSNLLDDMEKAGKLIRHKCVEDNYCILQLTEKGAEFVDTYFTMILTSLSPYYTYPILKRGDLIELTQNLTNHYHKETGQLTKRIIQSPSGGRVLDKGLYTLQAITASHIEITDDVNVWYRVSMADSKGILRFRPDQLEDENTEKAKRFGNIRIAALVRNLHEYISTVALAELIETLYNLSYSKSRMVEK